MAYLKQSLKLITILLSFCLTIPAAFGQNTIYQQNFTGQNGKGIDGSGKDTSGVDWSISVKNGSFSANSDYFMVKKETFEAQDTDGEVSWISDTINIAGYSNLKLAWDAKASGDFEANADVFKVLAFVDGTKVSLKQSKVDENLSGDPMFFGSTRLTGNLKSFSEPIGQTGQDCYFKIIVDVNAGSELCGWDSLTLTGTTATKPEPANQPTAFKASSSSYNEVKLSWTDAVGGNQKPDGYLIKASDAKNLNQPTDGNDPVIDQDLSDGSAIVKVNYGSSGNYSFKGLSGNTVYHFQIWSYTNTGNNIDFLTNPKGPADTAKTPKSSVLAKQDFDKNRNWQFNSSVSFFSHTNTDVYPDPGGWTSDGFYGIIHSGDATNMNQYSGLSDSLLGVSDLYDEGDYGTSGDATVSFEYIKVPKINEVVISFDYDIESFDNNDKALYKIYKNNNTLVKSTRIAGGSKQGTTQGTIQDTVSNNPDSLKLEVVLKQNGASDQAVFDNFKVITNKTLKAEPSNHPSGFTATNTSDKSASLRWCDVSSNPTPDGYLILGKTPNGSYKTFSDGNPVTTDTNWSDGDGAVTVNQGVEAYTFDSLSEKQTYNFIIYPFTNGGSNIDYKIANAATTQVGIQNYIVSQDFEGKGNWSYQTNPATCNSSSNGYWEVKRQADSIDPISGSKLFGFKDLDAGTCGNSGLNNTITFKTIGYNQLRHYKNINLAFQYRVFEFDNNDQIQYELIYNGFSAGKQVLFDGSSDSSTKSCKSDWVNKTLSIPDTVNQLQFRLYAQQQGSGDYAAIDNFRLKGDSLSNVTKKWDGGGNNKLWSNNKNWAPNGVPDQQDSVILDHSFISSAYKVIVDGSQTHTMGSLNIDPGVGDSITVKIPQSNGLNKAIAINNPSAPITINDKAKLVNASNYSGSSVLNFKDSLKIKNGGTYIHQTTSDHNNLVNRLSQKHTNKLGNLVFDVPAQKYTIDVSGATFGNLSITAEEQAKANQSAKYEVSGNKNVVIQGNLRVNSHAKLGLNAYKGQFKIGKNLTFDSTAGLIVADSLPTYFKVNNNKNISNSTDFTFKGSGYNTGFATWNIAEVGTLKRDGSNLIQLGKTLQVNEELQLTNGKIALGSHNLSLDKGALVSGADENSYIRVDSGRNGSFKRTADKSGFIPLPIGFQAYAPVAIQCSSCTDETFTARVEDKIFENPEQEVNPQTANAVTQTWSIIPSQSVSGVKLRFSWERSQEASLDLTNAFITNWKRGINSQWNIDSTGVNGNALRSATSSNQDLKTNGHYFGVVDAGFPFPFDLNYFRVEKESEQSALLEWETGSEKNSRLFRIEHHTQEDTNWSLIGKKQAKGTKLQPSQYNFIHDSAGTGKHFYRITRVDLEGNTARSGIETIKFDKETVSIEPRYQPSKHRLRLSIRSDINTKFRMRIFTPSGKVVINKAIDIHRGINDIPLHDWSNLKPGVYLLHMEGNEAYYQQKLIKH